MKKVLYFATGNAEKFLAAKHACDAAGIGLEQVHVGVDEIQEEDPQKVALDKAQKSFKELGKPVIITDDSWSFTGLRGFPGVYMHSMNEWFTPDDFLRLTKDLQNREVMLTQYLVYVDDTQQKVFTRQTPGMLLKEIRGVSDHPSHTITTMEGDNGLSIAEAYDQAEDKSSRRSAQIWHDFIRWYQGAKQ